MELPQGASYSTKVELPQEGGINLRGRNYTHKDRITTWTEFPHEGRITTGLALLHDDGITPGLGNYPMRTELPQGEAIILLEGGITPEGGITCVHYLHVVTTNKMRKVYLVFPVFATQ